MASASKKFPPVFIGGFRSGSTLLISYLGLHPRISAIYETAFVADLLRVTRILQHDASASEREVRLIRQWLGNPGLSREAAVEFLVQHAVTDIKHTQEVIDGLRPEVKAPYERYALGPAHILWKAAEVLDAIDPFVRAVHAGSPPATLVPILASALLPLFATHAAREGKSHWINKTPEILRFQPELRQMLGRVKLIHLIRDGRDVVHSSAKLNWWSVETGCRSWKLYVTDVRAQASRHPEDYLELRYEDLVTDHAGTLQKVLDFLEIEGDPALLVAAQEQYAPGSTSQAEAEQRIARWRSEMPAGDKATFKAIANDLLVSLGYAGDAAW